METLNAQLSGDTLKRQEEDLRTQCETEQMKMYAHNEALNEIEEAEHELAERKALINAQKAASSTQLQELQRLLEQCLADQVEQNRTRASLEEKS